ncbi:MAG: septum formation initiator family protein [PVC group bacterium]|nr:septum formation initiator family protein [PVC group bacterium]
MNLNWWKIILGFVVIVAIFFPSYSKIQKLKSKDADLSQELERKNKENKELSEEIEMLKTDPVYIEEVARDTLKVARENEIVFRVVNDEEE